MSFTRGGSGAFTARGILTIIVLGSLIGLVIHERALRLREAYMARRLVEERGYLHNEIDFEEARYRKLSTRSRLVGIAQEYKWELDGGEDVCIYAPRPLIEGLKKRETP